MHASSNREKKVFIEMRFVEQREVIIALKQIHHTGSAWSEHVFVERILKFAEDWIGSGFLPVFRVIAHPQP